MRRGQQLQLERPSQLHNAGMLFKLAVWRVVHMFWKPAITFMHRLQLLPIPLDNYGISIMHNAQRREPVVIRTA